MSAGLTTIDVGGNESWFTRDAVNVVVPFKKMGNEVSNMNVGDELQLSTSAIESEVTWSTSDNKILQLVLLRQLARVQLQYMQQEYRMNYTQCIICHISWHIRLQL